MGIPLLQTKLYIPHPRPALVVRPNLIARLNEGLHCKLTLVSAPAGFGKTTLVSSWIQQVDSPATWVSLDNDDNVPDRFLQYLIAALQKIDEGVGRTASSMLQSPQSPSLEILVTLLINDLSVVPEPAILVLDDYHVIHNLDIHTALAYFLDNLPPQLRLVIISREDPPLPLHRLRSSGEMIGIYARNLRFSGPEAAQFLQQTMHVSLAREDVAALTQRTEGWVAGLQLAALSLQGVPDAHEFVADFAGDDRYITDYLVGEVIDTQPARIQEFLLKTAIVDRFCVSLSTALMEAEGDARSVQTPNSRAIVEQLDQRNLFIVPLDNRREWYRYHHLFADFLRMRLRDWPTGEISELHRRAAAWFRQHDYTEEAIHHYLAAGQYVQAAGLMERVGIRLIVQGQLRTMLDWVAALPADVIRTRPVLCVYHAWTLTVTGQPAAAEVLLQQAEQALPATEPQQARHIRGLIEMLHAYRARRQDNLSQSTQLLRRASEDLSADGPHVRSSVYLNLGFNYLLVGRLAEAEHVLHVARTDSEDAGAVYITLIAMAVQANCYAAQGKLGQATALYEEAIAYGLDHNHGRPFPPAGYAYAGLGQVLYEQNELDRSEELLTQAVQLGESIADWSMVRRGCVPLAWLKLTAGDSTGAQTLWQQALSIVRRAESTRVEAQLETHRARMHLMQAASDRSSLAAAVAWAESYRNRRPDAAGYQDTMPQMILAQVELAQGGVAQAIARLNQLAETAEACGHNDNLIKIRTVQAIAYAANGNATIALERLGDALALAEPEGYVRTFIDHGAPVQRLLQQTAARGPASDYVTRLLSVFPAALQDDTRSSRMVSPRDRELLLEPLTERERSMLRLMAAGYSNREIADKLYLSVNTIKVYASRLYSKLGVHRRGEAVARARELGLL